MHRIRLFLKNFVSVVFAPILFIACVRPSSKTPANEKINLSPTITAISQSALSPSLLAEWTIGEVHNTAWSPDSGMFAVNYWLEGSDSNSFVQAFDVRSLEEMWTAENSLASDLVFTPDGQFIVEPNLAAPYFYWRSVENGKVVRQGEITSVNQIERGGCNGGAQVILANVRNNTALTVDFRDLLGPSWGTQNMVVVRQLDLETGKCKELFDYQGSFDLFDLNSSGTLLAYGGVGLEEDEVIIWDVEEQTEVCRTPQVDFGRFVPGENTLAVVRGGKIVFVDASMCQELRALDIAPAFGDETSVAFSPDGRWFAIEKESVLIVETSTGETLTQITIPENASLKSITFFLSSIRFSPNGRYLLIALYSTDDIYAGIVQLWQLKPQ